MPATGSHAASSAVLADVVLVAHFAFVVFVVGGFALILAGAAAGWRWVRNRAFRRLHLAAILFVAAESLVGMVCPLTAIEDTLRAAGDERSFIGRWVARALYYDLPEWMFAAAYVIFALAVAVAYWLLPPRPATIRR